ncbi:L,D-transpeptidase family protein [bacterium]|nr:L,D-transpeptidase family protein [bacterium]
MARYKAKADKADAGRKSVPYSIGARISLCVVLVFVVVAVLVAGIRANPKVSAALSGMICKSEGILPDSSQRTSSGGLSAEEAPESGVIKEEPDKPKLPEEISMYDEWVKKTLDNSKENNSYAIIVDKFAYRLYLAKTGKIIESYPIELGFNPTDDKQMEGDGTTPEGFYKVVEKRGIGQTRFYKGFLLNYPNELDKEEFKDLKASGQIPADASIGGMILIHGCGSGKPGNDGGMNWTLGCVSLSDEDVDSIFSHVNLGTPVTIVKFCSLKQP